MVEALGAVIGSAAARSLSASINADASHAARAANAAADVMEAQQNPLVSLISGTKRGKGAAMARLAQMLGPMLQRSNGNNHQEGGPPDGPTGRQRSFTL